jgi:hypothetical protein
VYANRADLEAAFGGSWSHTQMVRKTSMLKKQGRVVETHRSAAMILIISVRSRRAESCCHHAFFRT